MNQEKIRKIIISEETFKNMKEELIEQLQKEEKVEIVVAHVGSIHDQKMRQHIANGGACVIVSSPKEDAKDIAEMENLIIEELKREDEENKRLGAIIKENYEELMGKASAIEVVSPEAEYQKYNNPRKKYSIPRTIGRPNSTKKGGR